ncbi:hypothetical protein BKA63DRAFT_521257 [Paraphoma chrysanthemicola]|nr:hypothetical protein BKA63DRAFT_521257 [Paraphoma chrysanthemicola]
MVGMEAEGMKGGIKARMLVDGEGDFFGLIFSEGICMIVAWLALIYRHSNGYRHGARDQFAAENRWARGMGFRDAMLHGGMYGMGRAYGDYYGGYGLMDSGYSYGFGDVMDPYGFEDYGYGYGLDDPDYGYVYEFDGMGYGYGGMDHDWYD